MIEDIRVPLKPMPIPDNPIILETMRLEMCAQFAEGLARLEIKCKSPADLQEQRKKYGDAVLFVNHPRCSFTIAAKYDRATLPESPAIDAQERKIRKLSAMEMLPL